jgi:hypothetical protein
MGTGMLQLSDISLTHLQHRLHLTGGSRQKTMLIIIRHGTRSDLFCPDGYARTLLSDSFFEKEPGVSATTCNWQTTRKLLELVLGGK